MQNHELGDLTPNTDVFTKDFASAVDYAFLAPLEGAGLDPVRPQAVEPEPVYVPSTYTQAMAQGDRVYSFKEPFVQTSGLVKQVMVFGVLVIAFSWLLRRGAQ